MVFRAVPPQRVGPGAMLRGSFGPPASVLETAFGDPRDSGRLTRPSHQSLPGTDFDGFRQRAGSTHFAALPHLPMILNGLSDAATTLRNSICFSFMKNTLCIDLKTEVNGNYRDIMNQFDRDLFEALEPPIGKLEIVEFTGSKTGDLVHLRFLWPLKAEWISRITDHGETDNEAYFVDEGQTLPPGLSYWRHEHIVRKIDSQRSLIIDKMHFRSYFILLSYLLYPFLYLTFYPRKKQYKSYFGNAKKDKR